MANRSVAVRQSRIPVPVGVHSLKGDARKCFDSRIRFVRAIATLVYVTFLRMVYDYLVEYYKARCSHVDLISLAGGHY
jgi:hypothetical protein